MFRKMIFMINGNAAALAIAGVMLVFALAPGGRLVIIDYIPKPISERSWGPPPEQQFPREQLDKEMAAAGFKVLKAYDFLPEQFFVIYVPQ